MKKIAIISTHPIQYNAPLFKLLTERKKIEIKVFYTWENSKDKIYDQKFGKEIKWDIPILEGYNFSFVKNISQNQGSHHFKGIVNPSLNQEIEEWKADAILVYGWNFDSHLKAMKYFKGKIPVYFRGDSTILEESKNLKTLMRRIWLKYIYHFVDYAFYVGTNNKNYFLKHGLNEKQLLFAPHAIDNERFFDNTGEYSKKAKQWRTELGFNEEDKIIIFIGKFEKKKNPLIIIEAAKHFETDKNIKFLFVGNGQMETEMKQNSGKNVYFLPFQNQSVMPIVYRLGNILCLPSSYNETWGLVVNEALACGLQIIASSKVGCAVDLINNETGIIFESENIENLIETIKKISNSKNFFSNSIIKNYSFYQIATIFEKI